MRILQSINSIYSISIDFNQKFIRFQLVSIEISNKKMNEFLDIDMI